MVICEVQETIINDRYHVCKCGDLELLVDTETGFFNATKLCHSHEKQFKHYVKCENSKSIKKLLTESYGNTSYSTNALNMWKNAREAGTYCHPILLLSIAMWCSNEFYVQAATIVNDFFNKTVERKTQFNQLLKRNELTKVELERNDHCGLRKINYAGFELIVDKKN